MHRALPTLWQVLSNFGAEFPLPAILAGMKKKVSVSAWFYMQIFVLSSSYMYQRIKQGMKYLLQVSGAVVLSINNVLNFWKVT